jgi:hypothetical protein
MSGGVTACGRNFDLTLGQGLHVKHAAQRGIWMSTRAFALGPPRKTLYK